MNKIIKMMVLPFVFICISVMQAFASWPSQDAGEETVIPPIYEISVSPAILNWSYDETDSKVVSVSASGPWSAELLSFSGGEAQFSCNPTQGGLGITQVEVRPLGTNLSKTGRTATLILRCGTKTAFVTLEQEGLPWMKGLSDSTNYVQATVFIEADGKAFHRDVTYYDGLGYPVQTLQIGASPSGKTLASQTVWDAMHRPDSVSFLPYVRSDGSASLLPSAQALGAQAGWYQQAFSDSRPFATKTYESSIYGRPTYIQKEGAAWNADGGHGSQIAYSMNTEGDDVPRLVWSPGVSGGSATVNASTVWPDSMLTRIRVTDEAGSVSDTYTDASGRLVCTRNWSGSGGTGTLSETLYAYDLRDSLALVIQPEGTAALKALLAANRVLTLADNPSNANNSIYREFCFGYVYDGWGNRISEHTPGGGITERVFDARDRIVLESTDLMNQKYVLTEYDIFNRIVAKSVISTALGLDSLRSACSASAGVPASVAAGFTTVCTLYTAEYFPFGAVSDATTGFVPDAGVVGTSDVETVNIKGMLKSEVLYPCAKVDGTAPAAGGITRTRRYYYDYRGRVVQIKETDSDGWSARYSAQYDFVGNVIKSRETHTDPETNTHSLLTAYAYDDRGRRLQCWRSFDDEIQTVVFYSYDELGRLSQKVFGDGPGEVGTEDRSYDLHGWTTDLEVKKDWGMTTAFSEALRYADPVKLGTIARFDGNISEIEFSTDDGVNTPTSNTYGYSYDGLKRLTDAAHYTGTSTTTDNLKTERGISFDRNGNITGLSRYGTVGLDASLTFTHTGNRLTGVLAWDGVNLPESYSATYDALGNLVTDSRKGLQFSYNLANLPCKAEGIAADNAGLTLNYGYLSDGTKTSSLTGQGEGLKYRGSFVYEVASGGEERLSSIAWDEGRVAIDYSQSTSNPYVRDEWHVCDHLGSTRMVIDLTDYGTVIEENEYLPFGTRIACSPQSASNRYRLAGKEEQRFGTGSSSLNLHLSDFGARYYDPYTARWTTLDPLAGKYLAWSPYNYCAGNPVNLVDPDGSWIWAFVGAGIEYGSQVYHNYKNGETGYDAWLGNINIAKVGLSAINPVGKFALVKTVAMEAAKATFDVSLNNGITVNKDTKDIAKETVKNTIIDRSVGRILNASSQDAVERATKDASAAGKALRSAIHKANQRPGSTKAARNLKTAADEASALGAMEAGTKALNNTIGANPNATRSGIDVIKRVIEDEKEKE